MGTCSSPINNNRGLQNPTTYAFQQKKNIRSDLDALDLEKKPSSQASTQITSVERVEERSPRSVKARDERSPPRKVRLAKRRSDEELTWESSHSPKVVAKAMGSLYTP